jgi:ATP-dependent Lhr-like helicase
MPLSPFHPAVARWFHDRIGQPTATQAAGWESIRKGRHTLIVAPTGSGKTFAAFLDALDRLLREGSEHELPEETRVVYVSPLKALSADIHKNLAEPRREIRQLAERLGLHPARITAAVRTGDTPAAERVAMLKHPPHILVTTPESLYLLLTARRSREMLRTVRTVIVDEIHAVIETRRGAHLALSLERLDHVAGRRVQRIGLSATVRPVEVVAQWLGGKAEQRTSGPADGPSDRPTVGPSIIDAGHRRVTDLALELPGSPLEAVMSAEVWEEVYRRLTGLIQTHRTTLVFVNTRRLAERLARQLAERLGEDAVTAHHGSLAREARLDAEERLKTGKLRALVATASLELGIDIGHVDLVCQIASPRRISTFLQRVGRSGHSLRGTPKGRLFPLTRDDLVECAALLRTIRRGELDHLVMRDQPLDVLAQQTVAEAASEDWDTGELFELFRGSYPYRDLAREAFDEIVEMVSRGFATRRGRRGALVHRDAINGRIRGRRGARMTAITSGGTIPENADYRVVLEPDGTPVGTVNEDFAIESAAGDIFQLGNTSWQILQVVSGTVRVRDARGQPPNIPFWLGEAPARSDELSRAVAELRSELEGRLGQPGEAVTWLADQLGTGHPEESVGASALSAAQQLVGYLAESRRLLGALPTQETIVAERFFDEAGGMQLVIHAPFGARMNRAWGLALRKRFCRQFNFELQAAATDEALLLSLGPQHSFPLEDVFRFLQPHSTESILVQALLDAPMFGTRWRWNANVALAVPRSRGGARIPPPLQRMMADDLLAAVFPDAAACLENIAGDREVPDHPLARQVIGDCLREAMDLDQLLALLERIQRGEIELVARDLPEPSPLAHEILNAKPYAFLDDAPLEERRTQAVLTRRALDPSSAADLGALDAAAIARVREEAWPDPRDADEAHDALLTAGFLLESELTEDDGPTVRRSDGPSWEAMLRELESASRARRIVVEDGRLVFWVAAERQPELLAVHSPTTVPDEQGPSREGAILELLRGRLEIVGPTTAVSLARSLGVPQPEVDIALAGLEREGVILRGSFTPGERGLEWCERRLLARIHRYTLNRLRAEIAPVAASEYLRFLLAWQRVTPDQRVRGLEGLAAVIALLDGYECPAAAWESEVLASRCDDYDPAQLDHLALTGRVAWGRLSSSGTGDGAGLLRPIGSTPIALFLRSSGEHWLHLGEAGPEPALSTYAREVLQVLRQRGASFFTDLTRGSGLLPTQVEQALAELAAIGQVTSDSFAGLRTLITPSDRRGPGAVGAGSGLRRHRRIASVAGIESAGRWSLLRPGDGEGLAASQAPGGDERAVEASAWACLRRYGVVFRRVLAREAVTVPWRRLALVYRRLEARGEIRGGRFVEGMSGEQFALPEAVGQLRAIRRHPPAGQLVSLSGADPLNLVGIVTPGDRIPGLRRNRIVFDDGVPLAALEGGVIRPLASYDARRAHEIERALVRRRPLSPPPDAAASGG